MKDNLIPFKVEHLLEMDIKLTDYNPIEPKHYKLLEEQHSCTLIINDKPILCAGILILANGVGEVWTVVDKAADKYPILIHKAIKHLIMELDKLNFHRLQAICAGIGNSSRWLYKLGFQIEGTLRQFGPNKEDYYLYSRIK